MEPTTTQQPPALAVRYVGEHGTVRMMSLRQAALYIGYRSGADSDEIWLDLRAGTTFEVANETFVPMTSIDLAIAR